MLIEKNTIIKLFPHNFPIGKNQNMSIWFVAKSAIDNSMLASNFIIISSKPENYNENKLDNICYVSSPDSLSSTLNYIKNWNLSGNISPTSYLKEVILKIKKLSPSLIEVENDVRLAGNIAKAFPNIPVIFIPHVTIGKKNFFSRVIQYYKYIKPIKEIIFVSKSHKDIFFSNFPYSKKPYSIIHNSYAHLPQTNIDINTKNNIIIYAGRATSDKGYKEFILGVIPVITQSPNWKATAVLSIETKTNAQKVKEFLNQPLIQEALLSKQLQILYNVPNKELFKLFTTAKIAVFPTHPSWIEGLPLVGIEAHYAKCAVITSNNLGFKELSGNNILYLSSVTATEVSNKIVELITNPHKLNELALSGYNHLIQNNNIKDLVKKYDSIRKKYILSPRS